MIMSVVVGVQTNFKSATMGKQLPFATALALTRTIQDAQTDVVSDLPNEFTLRGSWFKPRTKFGINIRPAKKDNLVAYIGTNAPWIEIQEEGGKKKPAGKMLAIPTANIRKKPTQRIGLGRLPRKLKRTFVINTKSGPVLFQRKGKGKRSKIFAVYVLEPDANVKKVAPIYDPTVKTVERVWDKNFISAFEKAIATMKR